MKPITVPYGGTIVEEWIELANSWNIIKMKPIAIRCGGTGWNTPDCTSREILNSIPNTNPYGDTNQSSRGASNIVYTDAIYSYGKRWKFGVWVTMEVH